jgi:hypothetical protein
MRSLAITGLVILLASMSEGSHAQWVPCNGPSTESVSALLVTGGNSLTPVLFAGTTVGLAVSVDGGGSWMSASGGLPNPEINALAELEPGPPPLVFVGTDGGISITSDNGTSWIPANADLVNMYTDIQALAVSEVDSSPPMLFAGTDGNGIFSSTNSGKSWIEVSTGLADSDILSLAASGSNTTTSRVFAGTDSGLYISADEGDNWKVANGDLSTAYIAALAVVGSSEPYPIVFAGTYLNGMFRSIDNGATWTEPNASMEGIGITALYAIAFPSAPAILLAGSDGDGVFLSTDTGGSWNAANTGLTDLSDFSFAVSGSDVSSATVFVGTSGSGVWSIPLLELLATNGVAEQQAIHAEMECYPNPMSQSTTITVFVPTQGVADIAIMNILGAPVAHVFSGELSAGEHEFSWNPVSGSDYTFQPGTYWCVVRINGTSEQIPIVFKK